MNGLTGFYLFIAAFSISQILLALAKILSNKKNSSSELLFCSFLFCVGIYLSQPLIIEGTRNPYWLKLIWQHLPTAIPALFLLSCASIFLDNYRFKAFHFLSIIIVAVPPFFHEALQLPTSLELLLLELPQLIEYLFMFVALLLVARSWRADLIEKRRRLRIWVMGVSGSLIFSVILAQQLSSISEVQIDLLHYPAAALLLVFINLFLLKLNPEGILFGMTKDQNQPYPTYVDLEQHGQSKQLSQLTQWMDVEKGYRNPKLTITELAWKVKLPEYRLRELINQGLGFRNFNEYLNHYRITEACKSLENSDESITVIAADVGFNSLSAFNRAFKEQLELTPSAYRKQKKSSFE